MYDPTAAVFAQHSAMVHISRLSLPSPTVPNASAVLLLPGGIVAGHATHDFQTAV